MLLPRPRLTSTVALCAAMLLASAATPAAQRTFVSSSGSDSDPCSIAAPCRSFDAALAETDPNGEIVVLDSAGYGAVVITQSVSIIAPPGVYAGITGFPTSPNGNGITVGGNNRVVLRGLSINGQGGTYGIQVLGLLSAPVVHIEDCVVSNFNSDGIYVSGPITAPQVFIGGTTVRGNFNNGIRVTGSATVHVDRSRIERNGDRGIYVVDGPNVTVTSSVVAGNSDEGVRAHSFDGVSQTTVAISDSSVSGNGASGIYGDAWTAGNLTRLRAARNTVARNATNGVVAESLNGSAVRATVSDNLVTDNATGVTAYGGGAFLTASNNSVSGGTVGLKQAVGALFQTRNNNIVQFNGTDVSGTTTFVAGE